jgi:hypothetical protein
MLILEKLKINASNSTKLKLNSTFQNIISENITDNLLKKNC